MCYMFGNRNFFYFYLGTYKICPNMFLGSSHLCVQFLFPKTTYLYVYYRKLQFLNSNQITWKKSSILFMKIFFCYEDVWK